MNRTSKTARKIQRHTFESERLTIRLRSRARGRVILEILRCQRWSVIIRVSTPRISESERDRSLLSYLIRGYERTG